MPPVSLLSVEPPPRGANPYLQGNFAPLPAEVETGELWTEGTLPPDLDGYLLRTGPNPAMVPDPGRYHWFSGDGMVHAIALREGRAVGHRSRWVRTRRLSAELGTPAPAGPSEAIDGPANTHVVHHAGRILALCESGLPHRLDRDLSTVRVEDFDGSLSVPMTAHPHRDPRTGSLVAFGYDPFGPPYLWVYEVDPQGTVSWSRSVELDRCVMVHDMAVTQTRTVVFDLGVVLDEDLALAGHALPFRWDPGHANRIGLVDRGDPEAAVTWIGVDPCFVYHVMGAYDDGGEVVVDLAVHGASFDLGFGGRLGSGRPVLERWRINETSRTVTRDVVDDRSVEFPRIDELHETLPFRFGYAAEMDPGLGVEQFGGLLKFDRARGEVEAFRPSRGVAMGEPIFVRADDGRSDEEGWVLSVGYDPARDASDLYVLDASSFGNEPVAVVHLPGRIPFGFHGSFVAAGQLGR